MKHIDKLPSGSYRVRIRFNGKPVTKVCKTLAEAEAQLKEWKDRILYLKRISHGPLRLGPLKCGRFRKLTENEIKKIKSI